MAWHFTHTHTHTHTHTQSVTVTQVSCMHEQGNAILIRYKQPQHQQHLHRGMHYLPAERTQIPHLNQSQVVAMTKHRPVFYTAGHRQKFVLIHQRHTLYGVEQ